MWGNDCDQTRFWLKSTFQIGVDGSSTVCQMCKVTLFTVLILVLSKLECCQGCNSLITLSGKDGSFTSPAYPQNYPNNTNCSWLIEVPHGYTINLTFNSFHIEHHSFCSFDSVSVYDGSSTSEYLFGKYCGSKRPPPQLSSGSTMLINLITDHVDEFSGFNCSYYAVKRALNCSDEQTAEENQNIVLKGTTGSLITLFKNNSNRPVHCLWRIIALYSMNKGLQLQLKFTNLGLLKNTSCVESSISVYAGRTYSKSNTVKNKYCNNSQGTYFMTWYRANYLWVELKAENVTGLEMSSFAGNYEVVKAPQTCSVGNSPYENSNIIVFGNLTAQFDFTDSTDSIVQHLACRWRLTAPSGYYVKLEFLDFQFDNNCEDAFVEALDDGFTKRGKFCGPFKPWTIYSTTNVMHLALTRTKSSEGGRSFSARISAVKNAPDRCSKINTVSMNRDIQLGGKSGFFFSPNYPSFYHESFVCTWVITVPHPWRVRLHFRTFDLEDNACDYDHVEVRDGANASSRFKGKYCSNKLPADVYASSNKLWVKFFSDDTKEMTGFLASYDVFLPEPEKCSERNSEDENNNLHVRGRSGYITSPNYPNKYPSNIQCTWTISVPEYYRVALRFQTLRLSSYCDHGYVKVIDIGGRSLGSYCGNDAPLVLVSSSTSLWIEFRSREVPSLKDIGFNVTYSAELIDPDSECQTATPYPTKNNQLSLANHHGYFSSPTDYSSNQQRAMSCTWRARAPPGYHVELSFDVIDLPGMTCKSDFVEVRDGNSMASPVKTMRCGMTPGSRVYSSGRDLFIRFRSARRRTGYRGFIARYRMIRAGNCSESFADSWNENLNLQGNETGTVSSPGYPGSYPPNIRCTWKISVPRDSKMSLSFKLLDLGKGCSDFVEVKDGSYSFSSVKAHFCGSRVQEASIFSSGQHLMLHFESGNNTATRGKGFYAEYHTIIFDDFPTTESKPVHGIVIILGSFGGLVVVTLTGMLIYWLITRHRLDMALRHRGPPDHALTPFPNQDIPTLDDIPDSLIAEDRPPSYSEAIGDFVAPSTSDHVAIVHGGHSEETGTELPLEEARGLDNLAFVASNLDLTGDPPTYEDLYGVDPE